MYSTRRPISESGNGRSLRARIEWRDLREVPVAREIQDIVMNADRAIEDLAAARIMDVRADRRSQSWRATSELRYAGCPPATNRDLRLRLARRAR